MNEWNDIDWKKAQIKNEKGAVMNIYACDGGKQNINFRIFLSEPHMCDFLYENET